MDRGVLPRRAKTRNCAGSGGKPDAFTLSHREINQIPFEERLGIAGWNPYRLPFLPCMA
jgi:hypothetical protein